MVVSVVSSDCACEAGTLAVDDEPIGSDTTPFVLDLIFDEAVVTSIEEGSSLGQFGLCYGMNVTWN